jgi:hypothetical protein
VGGIRHGFRGILRGWDIGNADPLWRRLNLSFSKAHKKIAGYKKDRFAHPFFSAANCASLKTFKANYI